MKERVESHDPPDCVGYGETHEAIGYLYPVALPCVADRKPRLQFWLHVLDPQDQQQGQDDDQFHDSLQEPGQSDGGRLGVLELIAQGGSNEEVGQSLASDQQLPIPPILHDYL